MPKYLQLVKVGHGQLYTLLARRDVKFAYKKKTSARIKAESLRKKGYNVRVLHRKVGYQLVGEKKPLRF